MAQRKSAPPGRPGSAKAGSTASTRSGATARSATSAASTTRTRSSGQPGRPPTRRPGKSIVNQKQTPWGLIAVTVAIVLFAAAIVVVVIATRKSTPAANGGCTAMIGKDQTSYLNELTCASKIKGVTFHKEANRAHVTGAVKYDATPPVGGNHSQYWADCTGTVYAQPIANENAAHMLEHGAIWITYNSKTLPASGVAELTKYVAGQDRMALSPYPNLKTPVSVQAWGYQLFLTSASDPRIAQFILDLRYNQKTTPEYGATCSQPTFKTHPSTFGNPLSAPAANSGGA
jgi:hypothetical protein